VNQQMKIARLQGLLERVQTRARQERQRSSREAVAAFAEPTTQTDGAPVVRDSGALPPVVMALTADSTETDETRPFAKLTPAQLAMPARLATPEPPRALDLQTAPGPAQHTTDRPPPPSLELEPIESEAVELEPLEPEAPEPEPPASSRRPAQVREPEVEELSLEAEVPGEEKHDTEPPKSGPQLLEKPAEGAVATGFEVDFDARQLDRAAIETPALPSVAQLGQMVELEELPEGAQAGIELAPPPPIDEAPATPHEMEAALPGAQSPGAYSPELAPTARAPEAQQPSTESVFGAEPGSIDWEVPSEKETSGVIEAGRPQAEPAPIVEQKPVEATTAAAQPEPTVEEQHIPEPTLESVTQRESAAAEAAASEAQPAAGTLKLVAQGAAEPIELEVVPVVVGPGQVASANVAVFMGAVQEFKPSTFVEWLDASLELGKK
jgi:hypothetical protein